jgi:hypothetical protein
MDFLLKFDDDSDDDRDAKFFLEEMAIDDENELLQIIDMVDSSDDEDQEGKRQRAANKERDFHSTMREILKEDFGCPVPFSISFMIS